MKYKTMILVVSSILCVNYSFSHPLPKSTDYLVKDVNGFDALIMNPYSKPLDYLGTATMGLSLLTPTVLFAVPSQDYWKIGLQYAETIALAYGAKELCKLLVSRPRPYMYFEGAPQEEIENGDWDASFISGHATLSFAAASFTSFLFCQYFPDSNWKIPVILSSYALATTTSVLRLASGNHFLTDVLCGAVIGSGIGILVPYLNSFWINPSYKEDKFELFASPMGVTVNIKF